MLQNITSKNTVSDKWPQVVQNARGVCKAISGALALLSCVFRKHWFFFYSYFELFNFYFFVWLSTFFMLLCFGKGMTWEGGPHHWDSGACVTVAAVRLWTQSSEASWHRDQLLAHECWQTTEFHFDLVLLWVCLHAWAQPCLHKYGMLWETLQCSHSWLC